MFADTGDDKYLLRLAPLVERDEEVVLILLIPKWPGFENFSNISTVLAGLTRENG